MLKNFARLLCWLSVPLLAAAFTPTAVADGAGLVRMYQLIELPAAQDGLSSQAYAVNNTGQIVGWAEVNGNRHAAHWHNRVTTDLQGTVHFELLHPYPYYTQNAAEAYDISDADQIVGTGRTVTPSPPCLKEFEVSNGFLLRPGVLTDLATPYPGDALTNLRTFGSLCSNFDSAAVGISNSNHVVGWADTGNQVMHAFLVHPVGGEWVAPDQDGGNTLLVDLGTLAASDPVSSATAVNDAGQVTGYSYTINPDGTASYHAFLVDPLDNDHDGVADTWFVGNNGVNDLMIDLNTLGGTNSWGRAINNNGEIVGEADLDAPTGDHYTRAFVWRNQTMTDLGTLHDDPQKGFSAASGINSTGVIVGWAENEARERRAFIFENGAMQDLNALLYPLDENGKPTVPSLTLTEARDVNDDGVIVGWGTVRSSGGATTRGFLLNPVLVDPNELAALQGPPADSNGSGTSGTNTGTGTSPNYTSTTDFGPPSFPAATPDEQDANTPAATPQAPLFCGASTLTVLPLTFAGLCWLRRKYR